MTEQRTLQVGIKAFLKNSDGKYLFLKRKKPYGGDTVLKWDIPDTVWGKLWWGYCIVMLTASVVIAIWLTVGGAADFRRLFRTLASIRRDIDDDGTVVGHQSLADLPDPSESEQ